MTRFGGFGTSKTVKGRDNGPLMLEMQYKISYCNRSGGAIHHCPSTFRGIYADYSVPGWIAEVEAAIQRKYYQAVKFDSHCIAE